MNGNSQYGDIAQADPIWVQTVADAAQAPGSQSVPPAVAGWGRRQRQKLEKFQRITAAARSVFIARGFDSATTREIAQLADVSQATIFLYAKDKRNLLFLAFNEDMDRLQAEAVAAIQAPGLLVDRLVRWYRPFLQYFSVEVPIELIAAHERIMVATGDPPTAQGLCVQRRGDTFMQEVLGLIEAAISAKELRADLNPSHVFRVIRSILFGELERWHVARPHPPLTQSLDDLRTALDLVVQGLRRNS